MNLLRTASLIVVLTLAGRLLGFFRNIYLSNLYGLSRETDLFTIASNIPMTLFLVVPGAINAVLIPTLRGILEQNNRQRANELYQKVLFIVLAGFAVLAVLGVLFSRQTALLLGVRGEDAIQMTAELLQWMWPSAIFIGLVGLWSSVCNAHQHFFTPTVGTVANGAVVIVFMYLLVPHMGVNGLALATSLGYLSACLTMLPTMRSFGYRHRFRLGWKEDEAMRSMGERVIPIFIGAVIANVTTFLERGLANSLGEGRPSALMLANTINQLPQAVFVGAFTLPLFPLLASYVERGEMNEMKQVLQKGLAYLLILLIPITVGLIMYGEALIELIYERGSFTHSATQMTDFALTFYSLGLYALGARDLLTRAFYALKNTRTPVIIGFIGILAYLATAWISMPWLSHGGLALSASVSAICQSVLLFALLWRKIGRPVRANFLLTAGKVLIASLVMGAAISLWEPVLAMLPLVVHLVLGIGAGAVVYGVVLFLTREPLVSELAGKVWKRRSRSVQ
ncbi:murein biosynthesis integral membrane protein MurJ [Brevibacillus fulvus]|uniref:Probable lipid II flippase MurJ n=1 Tax=Brevibacillus fulvus TaxID=1125967 RepID=A0A939BP65_9BACL|nr:murein biosynthesis integral membrane protein MurJ [Brevibacillus fulvus]MBM7590100.1 putative peptidoglycan lipid II flippase [Brevibacillus fulvus]